MKKFVLIILVSIAFLSCEKDITVNFPQPPDLLVVDGHIENGQYAYVHLTKNASFFAPTDSASLINYLVTNATVIVSDGILYDTLTFSLDFNNFPYFPLVYKGNKIIGQPNHFYSLTITANGQTVTSYTSIPVPVVPDSAWFKVEPNMDSLGYVWINFHDPDTLGNCYRFFTKRISHRLNGRGPVKDLDFLTDINSVYDDKIFNGSNPNFDFDRGHIPYDTNADEHNIERGLFVKGDTIVFKYTNIDRPHFDFWNTEGIAAQSSGNPFASPITVKSNIKGGLGIWGGYGAAYDTIIAK